MSVDQVESRTYWYDGLMPAGVYREYVNPYTRAFQNMVESMRAAFVNGASVRAVSHNLGYTLDDARLVDTRLLDLATEIQTTTVLDWESSVSYAKRLLALDARWPGIADDLVERMRKWDLNNAIMSIDVAEQLLSYELAQTPTQRRIADARYTLSRLRWRLETLRDVITLDWPHTIAQRTAQRLPSIVVQYAIVRAQRHAERVGVSQKHAAQMLIDALSIDEPEE